MGSVPFRWGMLRFVIPLLHLGLSRYAAPFIISLTCSLFYHPLHPSPQVCFGARAPLPDSPLFGLVWWRSSDSGVASLYRHQATLSPDAVARLISIANDGVGRGVQVITDEVAGVQLTTEFLMDPKAPSSFQATITITPIVTSKEPVAAEAGSSSSSSLSPTASAADAASPMGELCVAYYCASQGSNAVFSDDISPPSPATGHAYDLALALPTVTRAPTVSGWGGKSVVELLTAAVAEDEAIDSAAAAAAPAADASAAAVEDCTAAAAAQSSVSMPPILMPDAGDTPLRFRVAATLATATTSSSQHISLAPAVADDAADATMPVCRSKLPSAREPQLRSLRLRTTDKPWDVVPPLAAATAAGATATAAATASAAATAADATPVVAADEGQEVVVTAVTVSGACELQVTVTDHSYAAAAAAAAATAAATAAAAAAADAAAVSSAGAVTAPVPPNQHHHHDGISDCCSDGNSNGSLGSFELVPTLTPTRTPSPFAAFSVMSTAAFDHHDGVDGDDDNHDDDHDDYDEDDSHYNPSHGGGHAQERHNDCGKGQVLSPGAKVEAEDAEVAPTAATSVTRALGSVVLFTHPHCPHALACAPLPAAAARLRRQGEERWQRILARFAPAAPLSALATTVDSLYSPSQSSSSLASGFTAQTPTHSPLSVPPSFLSETLAALIGGLTYLSGRGRWLRPSSPIWGTEGE